MNVCKVASRIRLPDVVGEVTGEDYSIRKILL